MLKIILADNQAIFRTGAAKVLAVEDDLRIVAQAENTEKVSCDGHDLRRGDPSQPAYGGGDGKKIQDQAGGYR
jgi:hypothetical protein